MAGSLRDISLRHLPDLSDASFSFSFQIPTEATVADDLLRADGGDDFLHAAAGDDSRVDEHELVPAATSSPPKLLPTTRSNIASSRVPKPVSAKAKGALLENDDNDATRTISAPVKSTVTEGPRAKVLDEGARVEDKPRTRASKPAPIMKHTRSNSAVSATSTNPPSKSKPKSTTSKPAIPAPAPPSDGGMAARLLMYGSGMHVDIDTTMDDAQGPRHLPPNDRDEDLADALREAAEEPIFSYAGEKDHPKSRPISPPTQSVPAVGRDERPVESASVQQSSDAHPPSVSAEAPLTLSQLSPQKDKPTASTTELDPGLSAPPAKPSTRAGSQDKSKKEKPASKVDSNVKRGVVKPKLKSTVDDSAKRVQVIPERTTADVDQEQEGGAPVSDVAEHEEVVDVDVAAVVPSASAVAPNVDAHEQLDELKPAENEEVQDDGGPLTVSQLSPRKQLEAQPDDGFMKRDRAPVRAPAPAKAARNATNVEKGKKPAQPVSKRDVQLKATPALPVSEMEETKPKMEENVEAELDSVEGA
ncbi:hypothetical protein FB45DRAFT_923755 [Roridomyces roridus]|uniref:Uncharacterized protein n=1 Tax=Roridomyces roridus TaxID=1738132 RepID=A0AAD7BLD4_9AGAR|nr:hypothetical protein FB45DRAFT_923755 [Roridomyces roridus]